MYTSLRPTLCQVVEYIKIQFAPHREHSLLTLEGKPIGESFVLTKYLLVVETKWTHINTVCKSKAFPLQASWGSWRLRLQNFWTIGPTHRPSLPPGRVSGTHFC